MSKASRRYKYLAKKYPHQFGYRRKTRSLREYMACKRCIDKMTKKDRRSLLRARSMKTEVIANKRLIEAWEEANGQKWWG